MTDDPMAEFTRQLFKRALDDDEREPRPSNVAPPSGGDDDMRAFVRDLFAPDPHDRTPGIFAKPTTKENS